MSAREGTAERTQSTEMTSYLNNSTQPGDFLGVRDQVPLHCMGREQDDIQRGALNLIETWYKNPRPIESPNPGSFIALHYIIVFFVKIQDTYWKWSAHLDDILKYNVGGVITLYLNLSVRLFLSPIIYWFISSWHIAGFGVLFSINILKKI